VKRFTQLLHDYLLFAPSNVRPSAP
jgi:hypothetical protein